MLVGRDIERFAEHCSEIADGVADEHGFVALRALLARFRAELLLRPLLVEGMIALKPEVPGNAVPALPWTVLVDSEKHPVHPDQLLEERFQHPLRDRFRYTVAHELVHTLPFQHTEVGLKLPFASGQDQTPAEFVRLIEQESDKLSSLLLLPVRVLRRWTEGRRTALGAEELAAARRDYGVSRYVLLNRLKWLMSADPQGLLGSAAFRNLGVGLGEWTASGRAMLKRWPLFYQFDRNLLPEAFLRILSTDGMPAEAVFDDPNFILCGGGSYESRALTEAGLPGSPSVTRFPMLCSVERTAARAGSTFLFALSRLE